MSSLFGTLWTAKSSLSANQLALQTTSNNVANAGTKGYSRQRVDMVESLPETLPFGQVGTGVTVDGIRRIRDQFLDQQYLRANQSLSKTQAEHDTWSQIEAILGEPSTDTGLQADMNRFFTSLQDLASYPTDLTTRRTVLEQAQTMAGTFNRLDADLDSLTRNLETQITGTVSEANDTLQQLADLNNQIQAQVIAGNSPNALLDKRDLLLDKLSELIGINRFIRPDGTAVVTLSGGGGVVLDGVWAATLGTQLSATTDTYDLTLNGNVVNPTEGKIAGLLASRNDPTGYVKYTRAQLDTLAATLISQINQIQAAGAGTAGIQSLTSQATISDPTAPLASAGLPVPITVPGSFGVFVYDATGAVSASGTVTVTATTSLNDLATQLNGLGGLTATVAAGRLTVSAPAGSTFRLASDTSQALTALGVNGVFTGTDAGTIGVNAELLARPELLTTGYPDPGTGVVGGADNRAALDMVAVREAKLLSGGTATLADFYDATVGVVGSRTAATANQAESQDLVARTIDNQRQQVSGVSIDEEMTAMIQFQRAFEASSKIIQVVDELLVTVVNLIS
jgi:flagellar hook-associated protein 1 FlgK